MFEIERPSGGVAARPVQSMEDALTFLRVSLAAEGVPRPAAQALFRLFRGGVQPNLVFDREAAAAREADVLSEAQARQGQRAARRRRSSRRATG